MSDKNNLNYFYDLLMASQEVRRDVSAALDLCYVATGRLDGFDMHAEEILASNGRIHRQMIEVLQKS